MEIGDLEKMLVDSMQVAIEDIVTMRGNKDKSSDDFFARIEAIEGACRAIRALWNP